MKKQLLAVLLAASMLLCFTACGASDETTDDSETITLSADDEALLEEFGDDLNVVEADDFAQFADSLDESYVGQVYQVSGYYISAVSDEEEDGEVDLICSSMDEDASVILLRYLNTELTIGSRYTVTGIIAMEEHEDHSHIYLDVVTVESYSENS